MSAPKKPKPLWVAIDKIDKEPYCVPKVTRRTLVKELERRNCYAPNWWKRHLAIIKYIPAKARGK